LTNWGRYLTAVNREYYDTLSSASKKSLEFQGGPFSGEELERFRADLLRDDMVALRLWDDQAKVQGIEEVTPRAREYLDIVKGHLEEQEGVMP
jgi:predicted HD phosphohydrolase